MELRTKIKILWLVSGAIILYIIIDVLVAQYKNEASYSDNVIDIKTNTSANIEGTYGFVLGSTVSTSDERLKCAYNEFDECEEDMITLFGSDPGFLGCRLSPSYYEKDPLVASVLLCLSYKTNTIYKIETTFKSTDHNYSGVMAYNPISAKGQLEFESIIKALLAKYGPSKVLNLNTINLVWRNKDNVLIYSYAPDYIPLEKATLDTLPYPWVNEDLGNLAYISVSSLEKARQEYQQEQQEKIDKLKKEVSGPNNI